MAPEKNGGGVFVGDVFRRLRKDGIFRKAGVLGIGACMGIGGAEDPVPFGKKADTFTDRLDNSCQINP